MKKIINYIFILVILSLIFIILNFYESKKSIFDDITILGLWDNLGAENEYEITSQDTVEIDVFETINDVYKKIAPGSKGSFAIKFRRPINLNYKIKINEKTSKPQNLFFILGNKKYSSIKEMENIINEKFISTEKIIINWEWKYYIDEINDIEDTEDGEKAQKYIFEIESFIEG